MAHRAAEPIELPHHQRWDLKGSAVAAIQ
jgi:hypothetical protein